MNIKPTSKTHSKPNIKTERVVPQPSPESTPVDNFVDSAWNSVETAKSFAPRLLVAPMIGAFSAVPGVGLWGANLHRGHQKGDPNVSTLSSVGTLGSVLSQTAGLAFAAASAGSYLTGLGSPATLGQISMGCFAVSGVCGFGSALGHDWS